MLKIFVVLMLGLILLTTACSSGQTKSPTELELERDIKSIMLNLPDGTFVPCLFYARTGENGDGDDFNWIALDCDWDRWSGRPR